MAASRSPNPRLGKSQALNISQSTSTRLATLVPSLTTDLSPVTVYQPGAAGGTGNELLAYPHTPVQISQAYGVWVAPDLNGDGSEYYVQVEAIGGGGGAGGGNGTQGGGGGGGAEYACETQYPVEPGASYAYAVGLPGSAGFNSNSATGPMGAPSSAGTNGGTTVFDTSGLGLASGVVANGGGGGDSSNVGTGGNGGTGSTNSIAWAGGNGGTNTSGNGSDNATALAKTAGMFAGGTLSSGIIKAWYVLNDNTAGTKTVNDNSTLSVNDATITTYQGGLATNQEIAPAQAPAYASAAGAYGPNPTFNDACFKFNISQLTWAAARVAAPVALLSGTKFTVSAWVQCDPSGTWGNTAGGSYAVIAANSSDFNGDTMRGYALYLQNTGTASAPAWVLSAAVGPNDGVHHRTVVSYAIGQTPGSWHYVVMTYNTGTLTLYVDGVSQGTSASVGYTSIPASAQVTTLGIDPVTSRNANWFFGYISNAWFATDAATSTLVTTAFGLTPATGGAGGGASGGPSAAGGNGSSGSGVTGGAGGVPATQPASLAGTTTVAMGGYAGSNSLSGNASPSAPAQGLYGGGGGASGNMTSPAATTVVTIPFTSAAAYYGTDAAAGPGLPYNVNQQSNPVSSVNSVLYAGGLAADTDTGSKNSLLLLPSTLTQQIAGGTWTVEQVSITFTNAFPSSSIESVLELGYTTDSVLPATFTAASFGAYIGAIPIPAGAGAITYDLTPSGIGALMTNGTAKALMIGPGATPTFDAFNSPSGEDFYAAIYGPGAADTFGNSQAPYMTVTLQKTATVQQGSSGAGGAIVITAITNANTPVAFTEPFAGTDAGGHAYGAGFTADSGNYNSWQPGSSPRVVETPHYVGNDGGATSFANSWQNQQSQVPGNNQPLRYEVIPGNRVHVTGVVLNNNNNTSPSAIFTLPVGYRPTYVQFGPVATNDFTPARNQNYYTQVNTNGTFTVSGYPAVGVVLLVNHIFPLN